MESPVAGGLLSVRRRTHRGISRKHKNRVLPEVRAQSHREGPWSRGLLPARTTCFSSSSKTLGITRVCAHLQSHFRLLTFTTPRTVACQAPVSMGFSRQEYWSGFISFSRGSSRPRDLAHFSCISCMGRQVL